MAAPSNTVKTLKLAATQATIPATYGALPATGYVRLAELRPILPFSDSTLWRRIRQGSFPTPLKLSERITAWRAEAIRQWIEEQGKEAA